MYTLILLQELYLYSSSSIYNRSSEQRIAFTSYFKINWLENCNFFILIVTLHYSSHVALSYIERTQKENLFKIRVKREKLKCCFKRKQKTRASYLKEEKHFLIKNINSKDFF